VPVHQKAGEGLRAGEEGSWGEAAEPWLWSPAGRPCPAELGTVSCAGGGEQRDGGAGFGPLWWEGALGSGTAGEARLKDQGVCPHTAQTNSEDSGSLGKPPPTPNREGQERPGIPDFTAAAWGASLAGRHREAFVLQFTGRQQGQNPAPTGGPSQMAAPRRPHGLGRARLGSQPPSRRQAPDVTPGVPGGFWPLRRSQPH